MKIAELKDLLKAGEWNDIEFKEARTAVPKSAFETVSAFANTHGGWLVFGIFAPQPDPLGEALTDLKIVRCGGHPWKMPEVEERLRGLGFEQVETFSPGSISVLVIARKPG